MGQFMSLASVIMHLWCAFKGKSLLCTSAHSIVPICTRTIHPCSTGKRRASEGEVDSNGNLFFVTRGRRNSAHGGGGLGAASPENRSAEDITTIGTLYDTDRAQPRRGSKSSEGSVGLGSGPTSATQSRRPSIEPQQVCV